MQFKQRQKSPYVVHGHQIDLPKLKLEIVPNELLDV